MGSWMFSSSSVDVRSLSPVRWKITGFAFSRRVPPDIFYTSVHLLKVNPSVWTSEAKHEREFYTLRSLHTVQQTAPTKRTLPEKERKAIESKKAREQLLKGTVEHVKWQESWIQIKTNKNQASLNASSTKILFSSGFSMFIFCLCEEIHTGMGRTCTLHPEMPYN